MNAYVTVQAFTPSDPLAVALTVAAVVIVAVALFVANHNLRH
jgi:hypothetical protein